MPETQTNEIEKQARYNPAEIEPKWQQRWDADAALYVPWALLILLVIAAFVYFYIRFSRVNNERRSQQWMEYTEAEASLRAREETPES